MPDQPSLGGPIARIAGADELLRQLDAELNAFLRSSPCAYRAGVRSGDSYRETKKELFVRAAGG